MILRFIQFAAFINNSVFWAQPHHPAYMSLVPFATAILFKFCVRMHEEKWSVLFFLLPCFAFFFSSFKKQIMVFVSR